MLRSQCKAVLLYGQFLKVNFYGFQYVCMYEVCILFSPVIGLHIRSLQIAFFAASSLASFTLSVITVASVSPAEATVLQQ
jgi:hypothetical protein